MDRQIDRHNIVEESSHGSSHGTETGTIEPWMPPKATASSFDYMMIPVPVILTITVGLLLGCWMCWQIWLKTRRETAKKNAVHWVPVDGGKKLMNTKTGDIKFASTTEDIIAPEAFMPYVAGEGSYQLTGNDEIISDTGSLVNSPKLKVNPPWTFEPTRAFNDPSEVFGAYNAGAINHQEAIEALKKLDFYGHSAVSKTEFEKPTPPLHARKLRLQ